MESSSSRFGEETRKQEEIRKQIALLQSQLTQLPNQSRTVPGTPKRKQPEPTQLAPPTPSPKKKKLAHNHRPAGQPQKVNPTLRNATPRPPAVGKLILGQDSTHIPNPPPPPSNLLNKLATINKRPVDDTGPVETIARTSAFTERPHQPPAPFESDAPGVDTPKRDDRLALIVDLEPGPIDHTPPFDDPNFLQLEPNSGIRLSSRIIPHDDLQEHLTGRFYLSPSRLYSSIRLLPDKQGYDVPVPGDWITIAVVAERGPLKYSRAPVGVGREDHDVDPKAKQKEPPKPTGKKYVNIKLIDFGARARSSSSATGEKAVIRGDAFLSLLLFEADGFDLVDKGDEGGGKGKKKQEKVYKGGSRGAFEAMSKLKEGDVIALLNPKILKPFQRASDTPHPTTNILALTPESASSIAVIGRARDLGMCAVVKKDGKVCGGWCDKRVSDVCEWHVQNAVERRRAGRAEFSIGTSGMSTTSAPKRKPTYDPARQWGLKPSDSFAPSGDGGGSTYVVSGHVVSSGTSSGSLYIAETMGREGQAKAKRKLSGKDSDRALKALLERDKEGMKVVLMAREGVGKGGGGLERCQGKDAKGKGKERARAEEDNVNVDKSTNTLPAKNTYSAQVIKQLGFDPAAKSGQQSGAGELMQKKLDALAAVQSSRKEIALGPRPGQKRIRSGVFAPKAKGKTKTVDTDTSVVSATAPMSAPAGKPSGLHNADSDSDDEDLEQASFGKPLLGMSTCDDADGMVDLDE